MNFIFSLVRKESSSSAHRHSSAMRATQASRRQRAQANSLMDRVGRMEDRG